MNPAPQSPELPALLRGDPGELLSWLAVVKPGRVAWHVAVIVLGSAAYGAAMGAWRDPLLAAFVAMKFPLVIILTMLGNALLNGMLAPLLGLNAGLRQSLHAILLSFVIASAILGSFSPIVLFLIWTAPPLGDTSANAATMHALIKLVHVLAIAFAGIAANLRLLQLLHHLSGSAVVARRVLFSWLAGNLLLGSQLVWILRPFIGSPWLPVEFLRPNAFEGNFFETVFRDANLFFR